MSAETMEVGLQPTQEAQSSDLRELAEGALESLERLEQAMLHPFKRRPFDRVAGGLGKISPRTRSDVTSKCLHGHEAESPQQAFAFLLSSALTVQD